MIFFSFFRCLFIVFFAFALISCQTTGKLDQSGPIYKSSKTLERNFNKITLNANSEGKIKFKSIPLISLKQFLRGEYRGKPVSISGELSFPVNSDKNKVPAVIILHGQGGVSFYERNWEEILLQMGFATFLVDSKSNRGCHQVFGGCAAQHHGMAHMVDAFQALKILSSHPKIDSKRIALFGISIGGKATLYAGVKRFKKLWSHAGQNFAAYVPLYPPCNTTFLQDEFADGNPVRIHIGEKDEWASATACKDYVKRLQNKGKDISVVVYPGAHHGFDTEDPRVSGGIDIPGWQNVNCRFRESLELGDVPQQVVQIKSENGSKKPSLSRIAYLMYDDSCATGSARLEYDSGAASRARQSIEKFLVSVLKNP